MSESQEGNSITANDIHRAIDAVVLPGELAKGPRLSADVAIEDAVARRSIAKANQELKEETEKGKI